MMLKKMSFLIIALMFPLLAIYAQNVEGILVSGDYKGESLVSLLHNLEADNNLQCFYKTNWIDTVLLDQTYDSVALTTVLRGVLPYHGLTYYVKVDNQLFIFPKHFSIVDIPDFSVLQSADKLIEVKESSNVMEKQYLKGRKQNALTRIVVGQSEKMKPGKLIFISGKLEDENSGEPIIGATMYINELKKGAASDMDGVVAMALLPGNYTVQFKCIGMEDFNCNMQVYSDGFFHIDMQGATMALEEVTINADDLHKRSTKVGMERVTLKSIKNIPVLLGEKDVIKISQTLPGIVSVGEGSGGVNVRGGNADQNLFYLNDIPIYNTSHLFGFFSAINSSIVKDFSIYKAHVPTEYGGRLSSVFLVKTRKGNKKKVFAQGGVSPITANLALELPLIKDKVSLTLSGRSTYSNWLLKKIDNPDIQNSKANFNDFSGGVDYKVNDNNSANVFFNYSYDFFSLNDLNDYGYSNMGVSGSFTHRFTPKVDARIAVVGSKYSFSTIDKTNISAAYSHDYQINHTELKAKVNWFVNDKHKFTAGFNGINYLLNRGEVLPYGEESKHGYVNLGIENGIETGLYVEDQYNPYSWLAFNVGLRFSSFFEYGPKQVYTYTEGLPKENITISDTIDYAANELISSFSNPELRLATHFKLSKISSLKFSFTQMTQYLFMLSNTISIAPSDQWKMVDSHITPPKLWQLGMGFYQEIIPLSMSFSAETYIKKANNVVEYKDGADFISVSNVETTILQGDQDAYGLELMLSKKDGKFNGWISYAYSRSMMQIDGPNSWDKINRGEVYPSNYDKPNVLNVIANYQFNRRITFSTNIVYSTGQPITYPKSVFYVEGVPYVQYSDRNQYRIPDYFRIDASLTLDGNLKKKKPFHSYWSLSVYNLTGRKNANAIFFQSENKAIRPYKYSVIGTPILTLSWNFKIGNYNND